MIEFGSRSVEAPPAGQFESISAGESHTCGVTRVDGWVICWGLDGRESRRVREFISVSAGGGHTCGLRVDERAVCWGGNYYGQATPPEGEFAVVSAGSRHMSAGWSLTGRWDAGAETTAGKPLPGQEDSYP